MGKLKSVEELFEGRHFDREVIILCVLVTAICTRARNAMRSLPEATKAFAWLLPLKSSGLRQIDNTDDVLLGLA